MKEFIKKLIGRLEEAKERANCHYNYGDETAYRHSIEIVNELAESYYIHYEQEIRAKVINEFATRLKDLIAKNVEDAENSNDLCCEIFQSEIDEIAEQLKAGVENE